MSTSSMFPTRRRRSAAATRWLVLLSLAMPSLAWGADPKPGPPLSIHRVTGPIVLDGDLSDAGWRGVEPDTTWFETNPGDNVEPPVANAVYLAYDDTYLYAGFRFGDPHPQLIRGPLGDHDAVPSSTDYAGLIIDSGNDGKTAQMFLANPNGVQYDALTSDVSGEDSSPDFYWDAVGKLTATGWNLEIRVPFSSLRYRNAAQPTFGLLMYRNYPRDRRYQFFTARLPRDVNCFVCNSSKLSGLAGLPHDSHFVAAPFTTASRKDETSTLGSPLDNGKVKRDAGLDIKWNPLANASIDATLKPDFSQVESDAAQIAANERFALFYPEKRAFFLEGVDLLSTPFQAVYTRTITSPSAGLRATGKVGSTAFTALVTHDRGGGLAILPGAEGSDFAEQDFGSDVGVVRVRHDMGLSFFSVLATQRRIDGGGHNTVFGPDFQWRPNATDAFAGQALWSDSRTPHRTDLAGEWDGSRLADRAGVLNWSHNTRHVDLFLQGEDLGPEFRADDGFLPQVGFSEGYFQGGYTIRPTKAFLSRVRFFTEEYIDSKPPLGDFTVGGHPLFRHAQLGAGMDGRLNTFFRFEINRDDIRVGDTMLQRWRPRVQVQASPGRLLNQISLDTYLGDEIDFANGREGRGLTETSSATLRPSDHLELQLAYDGRWLDVHALADPINGPYKRLLTAQVERVRAQWSFNARMFARLIGQYVQTTRDPSLYLFSVPSKSAELSPSALFAYKLNWQTVLYAGYGDDHLFDDVTDRLQSNERQVFAKLSYAWQH